MKTTIDIPRAMLRDAMRHTKARTKKAAVLQAIDELNRRHALKRLLRHAGTSDTFMPPEELAKRRAEGMRHDPR